MTSENRLTRRWLFPLGVLVMLLLASLACVGEARDVDGFNMRRAYDLESGQHRDGDQVILAYEIDLQAGSAITGDVTLTGDQVDLAGRVAGDVVVVADRLDLGSQAVITGDLIVCVKELHQAEGAQIEGELREECDASSRVSVSNLIESGWDSWRDSWWFRVSSAVIGALLYGALAALGTLFFPRPLVRMSETIQRSPVTTGGIGCLTMVVALGLTAIYVVSLLLILPLVLLPFVALGWVLVGLLSLLGWLALAEPFGVLMFRRLRVSGQPRMINAALGGVALALLLRVWSVFWFTAWIGILATVVLGSIGLGAVLLTRVGTRPFPRQGT